MKNKLYLLAFLFGLAVILSGAALLKRMGLPLQLGGVSPVQAAGLPPQSSFSTGSGAGYSLDWTTIDAGGGQTSGSGYQMSAALGQPDAGTSSGGGYTLQGGFLPGTFNPWRLNLPVLQR